MRKIIGVFITTIILMTVFVPNISFADKVHRVAPGETLYNISKKYGISSSELIDYNRFINNPNILFTRQVLIIPERQHITYVVQLGDTLYKVSKKLGVTIQEIVDANKISDMNALDVGQVILIPSGNTHKYTVKSGDTLYKISQSIGVSVTALAKENNLTNLNQLFVGQILRVPGLEPKPPLTQTGYIHPLAQKYPNSFFTKGKISSQRIALTFDDGPDEVYTAQVLDILKAYGAKATFFLLGSKVEKHPELVKRMIQEGHTIANHTWNHPDMRKLSQDQVYAEMIETEAAIEKVTGLRTATMRPPFGFANNSVVEQLNAMEYKAIQWTIDSVDWDIPVSVDELLIRILPNINKEDTIILMHDSGGDRTSTVKSLPELLETLQRNGYFFVTTDKILDIKPYK